MTASQPTLATFLEEIERRAFRMARLSVGDTDKALDIVQDAMERMVRHYARKPSDQWQPLFYRILQNRLRDVHRRDTLHRKWFQLKKVFSGDEDSPLNETNDFADTAHPAADEMVYRADRARQIETALQSLSQRQRQVFLLRAWQELSVAETAQAMACSQSAVKTHYTRALRALQSRLKALQS